MAPFLSFTRSARRGLAVAALTVGSLAGLTALGASPASAGTPDQCIVDDRSAFVCDTYASFYRRTPSSEEVAYWAPQLPARKTFFLATVARSLESRRRIIAEYYNDFADRDVDELELEYWQGEVLKPNGFRRLEAALYGDFESTPEAFVGWAFYGLLGREPSMGEVEYWGARAEATTNPQTAADIAFTTESRRTRIRYAYRNELGFFPDTVSRDYWAEKLRTGTSYLDVRIAIKASPDGYPEGSAYCSPLSPPVRDECSK